MAVESAMRQRSPLLAVAVVGTALLAVAGWSLSNQGASSVALSQVQLLSRALLNPSQERFWWLSGEIAP